MLALSAVKRRPLPHSFLFDGHAAGMARFSGAAINAQRLRKVAGVAIAVDEIAQRCATLRNRVLQYLFYGIHQQ